MCSYIHDFHNKNIFLTAKLSKQDYRYHKIRKAFSKFYHRHSELIVKYNIHLKTLLQQGISEPIFYGIFSHIGQCKSTVGCYNELVVANLRTGAGVKGKKIYTC